MKIIHNTKINTFLSIAFSLALVLTPSLSFAKDDNKKDDNNNSWRKNTVCLKAFGQLIRNGWKETRGEVSVSANCRLPFGIFKKLTYVPNPSTVDTVAPIINSFVINPQSTKAEVKWTTNEKTRGVVFYGTTTPVLVRGATTTGNILNSIYTTNGKSVIDDFGLLHINGNLTLRNLTPDTTYYAILAVRDASGNVTVSSTATFTTTHGDDINAPIISNIMTSISLNTLGISWKTNEPATGKLFYGTSTGIVNMNVLSTTTLSTNHSFSLPVIASTTPYHVILQSADVSGNTTTSAEYSIVSPF